MNTRRFLFSLVVGLLVAGLVLAAFGKTVQAAPEQRHAESAMEALVARYGSLDKITDPGDVSAYRWLAIARFYEKYTPTFLNIQAAQQEIVARYGSLDKVSDAGDAQAYRYLGMAKFYIY